MLKIGLKTFSNRDDVVYASKLESGHELIDKIKFKTKKFEQR